MTSSPDSLSPASIFPTHELLPAVYDELRELARQFLQRERPDHTLQATALVHEVYLRLAGERREGWSGRREFFAVAARTIRRLLINHENARRAVKRGGGRTKVALAVNEPDGCRGADAIDLLALDEALTQLAGLDERQGRIVELRFFAGLSNQEVADVLGVSERTVRAEWSLARAWLRAALHAEDVV